MSGRIATSLGAVVGSSAPSPEAIDVLRAKLWEIDVAVIDMNECPEHLKPGIKALMARKHGRRMR